MNPVKKINKTRIGRVHFLHLWCSLRMLASIKNTETQKAQRKKEWALCA